VPAGTEISPLQVPAFTVTEPRTPSLSVPYVKVNGAVVEMLIGGVANALQISIYPFVVDWALAAVDSIGPATDAPSNTAKKTPERLFICR
jgi:hypothetical protein